MAQPGPACTGQAGAPSSKHQPEIPHRQAPPACALLGQGGPGTRDATLVGRSCRSSLLKGAVWYQLCSCSVMGSKSEPGSPGQAEHLTHRVLGSSGNCKLPKVSGRSRMMEEDAEVTVTRREPGQGGQGGSCHMSSHPEPIPWLTPMPPQKAMCPAGILLSFFSSSLLSSSELSLLGPTLPW